jgi:bacterioferritin-associated ferredoxin
MYVCVCNAVTDRTIREAAARGVSSLEQLALETGAGVCCGACRPLAIQILQQSSAPAFERCALSFATA